MKKSTRTKTERLFEDYEGEKRKHLEKLASRMLKRDEKFLKLKNIEIDKDFLDNF